MKKVSDAVAFTLKEMKNFAVLACPRKNWMITVRKF